MAGLKTIIKTGIEDKNLFLYTQSYFFTWRRVENMLKIDASGSRSILPHSNLKHNSHLGSMSKIDANESHSIFPHSKLKHHHHKIEAKEKKAEAKKADAKKKIDAKKAEAKGAHSVLPHSKEHHLLGSLAGMDIGSVISEAFLESGEKGSVWKSSLFRVQNKLDHLIDRGICSWKNPLSKFTGKLNYLLNIEKSSGKNRKLNNEWGHFSDLGHGKNKAQNPFNSSNYKPGQLSNLNYEKGLSQNPSFSSNYKLGALSLPGSINTGNSPVGIANNAGITGVSDPLEIQALKAKSL